MFEIIKIEEVMNIKKWLQLVNLLPTYKGSFIDSKLSAKPLRYWVEERESSNFSLEKHVKPLLFW